MANNTTNGTDHGLMGFHIFTGTTIFSIVFVFVMLIPTAFVNGLTLFAMYRDPLKCFRNPLAIFLSGVIVADFLSAILAYPFLGAAYAHDLHTGEHDVSFELYHVGIEVLTATITISFMTLLALAISQLISIRFPMRYERCVTNRSAKIGVICIWSYAVVFTTIPHFFDAGPVFFIILLIVHISIVTMALVILYMVTYCFFVSMTRQLDIDECKQVNREFLKGTCLLALLQVLLVWPFAISIYALEFISPDENNQQSLIVADAIQFICDNILIIKFLLDPLVLVWRLPKYRQALKAVYASWVCCGGQADEERRVSYYRNDVEQWKKNPDNESLEDIEVQMLY